MYTILGADGQEYGPVDASEIREWLAQGRANLDTKARVEGTTEWKRIGDFPELAAATGRPAAPLPSSARSDSAAEAVKGPATGLMVTAIIGGLLQLMALSFNMMGTSLGPSGDAEGLGLLFSGTIGSVFSLIGLAAAVVVFMGAQKMKALESHSWAMAASIVAIVPCVSPCCIIGTPLGIWSLVVLSKPEIKQSFH